MGNGKKRIGILTGGGDVPGLNPAIRGVVFRAEQEGYEVVGFRRGWAGLIQVVREKDADNSAAMQPVGRQLADRYARTGGTFLHTSRTRPSSVPAKDVPEHLRHRYSADKNDLTPEVLANLEFLGIEALVPIGGDDTLSYAVELGRHGVPVVAIPKTMDNDVPGTDYCIGFSTTVTRTIALAEQLRTCAASHERIVVLEVFGRYAGFTALVPTWAGAAHRCVIPEHQFDPERLAGLLVADRNAHPDKYSICLVSEGATPAGGEMSFVGADKDMFGHAKLGGMGDQVAKAVKEISPRFNAGRRIDMISMNLSYLVRSGAPDSVDSMVPMAWGNLAVQLLARGESGKLVALRQGRYEAVDLETVVAYKRTVDVERYYDTERYRPTYASFELQPMFGVGVED